MGRWWIHGDVTKLNAFYRGKLFVSAAFQRWFTECKYTGDPHRAKPKPIITLHVNGFPSTLF